MKQILNPSKAKSPTLLGLLLLLLGGLAIAVPLLATIEISWFISVLFIVSGIMQLIHTFQFDPMRSKVGRILLAALSIVTGVLVLRNPIASAFVMTFLMAFYFLAAFIGRAALALELNNGNGKGWLAFSSIVSLFIGIYLMSNLSSNALLIPGLFLGVDLIFYGIAFITVGISGMPFGTSINSIHSRKAA